MSILKKRQENNAAARPGFNGQGTIDLNDLTRLHERQFKDAHFSHFEFSDLEKIDTEGEQFWNTGVRESTENEERIESFRVSFRHKNFETTYWPPCKDVNGRWMDGRGRIIAAQKNGERWIPTAVYTRDDDSIRNTVTNGLIANKHTPQYPASFDDYVAGGVHLISTGELKAENKAVSDWLYHDLKIEEVYDNSINGQVTRLCEKVIARARQDTSLVRVKDPKFWKSWLKNNLGYQNSDYTLVNMTGDTYTERLWCRHILPALDDGSAPVNIVYYSTSLSPKDMRTGLKRSMLLLERFHRTSYELVNRQMPSELTLSPSEARPYTILGAVPQILLDHNCRGANLVKVEKY